MSFPPRAWSRLASVLCWVLAPLFWPELGSADSVVLSPVADTTLFQTLSDYNLGGLLTVIAGTTFSGLSNRALFRFDVAAGIPPNALLQGATLSLTVTKTSATQPHLYRLHRMNRPWTEGTGAGQNTGEPAKPGESTWETVSFPAGRWSAAGAAAPGDFNPRVTAERAMGDAATYEWPGGTEMLGDVEEWRTHPERNFGWILVCADEGQSPSSRRIASREDLTHAPQLILTYAVPARLTADLPAVADTSLFEYMPDNNLGGAELAAGAIGVGTNRARALLQFNPGPALPPAAILTGAQLRLNISRVAGAGGVTTGTNFLLHRMLTSWGEGSKADLLGRPATEGEANWYARFFPDAFWAEPGAAAGLDYTATPSAVQYMDRLGPASFTNVTEDVQFWRQHPEVNFGWILIGAAENVPRTARRFSPREDPVNGPNLHLEYILPPLLESVSVGAGQVLVSFIGLPWNRYGIECSDTLGGGPWDTCTNLPPAGEAGRRTVTLPADGTHRFYRLALHY